MKTFYYPTYKCRFCEEEFNDGHPYCNPEDAKNNLAGLMAFRPIHHCDGGHIGIGYFTGLERLIRMNDIWTKLGVFLGHVLALTMVICAWLIIITVTLKVIWFTLFRILL